MRIAHLSGTRLVQQLVEYMVYSYLGLTINDREAVQRNCSKMIFPQNFSQEILLYLGEILDEAKKP